MARIRTVKPELFKHEGLFELERETGIPIRIAWVGLFTVCDREGRFVWRPRALKTDILPYDDVDFSRVLDAMLTRGLIQKYRVGRDWYGWIPTFSRHQIINNRERASGLPSIDDAEEIQVDIQQLTTRDARVTHATLTPLCNYQGEGKGREGKGRELEGKGREHASYDAVTAGSKIPPPPAAKISRQAAKNQPTSDGAIAWNAYATAYLDRYGTEPVRNARVNAQMAQMAKRVPADEAPHVARWYVESNSALYVRSKHCVDLLLRDCEGLRTEWATSRRVTDTEARQADQHQATVDAARWVGENMDQLRQARKEGKI